MRVLVIVNPAARRTRPHLVRHVADTFSRDHKVDVALTTHRLHATELAAEAVASGVEAVVAMGGDGTLNEVLQPLVGTDVRLGVIPGGSTNVFARTIGLPHGIVHATHQLAEALTADRSRPITLGRANDRYFAFCSGFGFDARVVHLVEDRPRLKRALGQLGFIWCGLLAQARSKTDAITVEVDRQPFAEPAAAAVICNADPYTFFGPLAARVCARAELDAGLDLTTLTRRSLLDLLRVGRRALTGPTVDRLSFVRTWHDRHELVLRSPRPLPVHVDGDPCGETTTLVAVAVPDAVRLVV